MQQHYRLYSRSNGIFYLEDIVTGKQECLKTRDKKRTAGLLAARNQAQEQPLLNIAMARAYMSAKSPEMFTRTWEDAMRDVEKG